MHFKLFKSSPYSVSKMVWMRVSTQQILKAADNSLLISLFSNSKSPTQISTQEEAVTSRSSLKTTNHWTQLSYPNSRLLTASNPVTNQCSITMWLIITSTKSTTTNKHLSRIRCNSIAVSNTSETGATVTQLRNSVGKAGSISRIIRKGVWKMVTMWTHSQLLICFQTR